MDITLKLPTEEAQRILDCVCKHNGYQDFTDEEKTIPNPETKAQFAKRMMIKYIKDCVIANENRIVDETKSVVAEEVNSINII